MSDVAASDGSFSCADNDCDVQQHVNDEREYLGDDSDWVVETVRRFTFLENASGVARNQALNSWRAVAGIVLDPLELHPSNLTFGNMAREFF